MNNQVTLTNSKLCNEQINGIKKEIELNINTHFKLKTILYIQNPEVVWLPFQEILMEARLTSRALLKTQQIASEIAKKIPGFIKAIFSIKFLMKWSEKENRSGQLQEGPGARVPLESWDCKVITLKPKEREQNGVKIQKNVCWPIAGFLPLYCDH